MSWCRISTGDVLCWEQAVEQIMWQSKSTCGQVTDGQKRQRSLLVKQTRNGARLGQGRTETRVSMYSCWADVSRNVFVLIN